MTDNTELIDRVAKLPIVDIPVESVKVDGKNPNRMSESLFAGLVQHIRDNGIINPIIVTEDMLLADGEHRVRAAKELDMTTIPARVIPNDEKLRLTLRQTMNKLKGTHDKLLDVYELKAIAEFDRGLEELSAYLGDVDTTLINLAHDVAMSTVPEKDTGSREPVSDAKTITQKGDVIVLGDHVLVCGDSTDQEAVKTLMGDVKAQLLFTSPPYGDLRTYDGGELAVDHVAKFISAYSPYAEYLAVNLGIIRRNDEISTYWDEYIKEARYAGLKLLSWNVWDKCQTGSIGQQTAMFPIRHEFVFVFGNKSMHGNKIQRKRDTSMLGKPRTTSRRQPDGTIKRERTKYSDDLYKPLESILSVQAEKGDIRKEHPATFPVKLPSSYIMAITQPGDIVVEPFGGSGTTLIACEATGRSCRMMELSERYCDVIVKRWEEFTGKTAERPQR